MRESTGQSQNRCVGSRQNNISTVKKPSKETLLGSILFFMGVFSDDFAAVDVREELCYHCRPEKAKFGELLKADKNK